MSLLRGLIFNPVYPSNLNFINLTTGYGVPPIYKKDGTLLTHGDAWWDLSSGTIKIKNSPAGFDAGFDNGFEI